MPRNDLGRIRRSQVLTQAGPGAIIDFRTRAAAVSAVCAGLELWPTEAAVIHEPRLERKLRVTQLRAPPATPEDGPGAVSSVLPAIRFPVWQHCPRCNLLRRGGWGTEPGEAAQHCGSCSAGTPHKVYVIPAPFVTACEAGHLDEFLWDDWVGHRNGCGRMKGLELTSQGAPGLAGLHVSCRECGASESMEGCFNPEALRRLGGCSGRRVWLPDAPPEKCPLARKTLQRGASNMYFPVIASALDIPPWSDGLQQKLKRDWDRIVSFPDEQLRSFLIALGLHRSLGISEEDLFARVKERRDHLASASVASLRADEYRQLTSDAPAAIDEHAEFEIRRETVPEEIQAWVSRLVRIVRLREVRVLRAFTRVRHPDPESPDYLPEWAPLSAAPQSWLPAVEVRGEGIFIELNLGTVAEWARHHKGRADEIHGRWEEEWNQRHEGVPLPRRVTSKLLLVHSLSHALIRQLSLECGYSSASLRERLYVDDECCGVLVYTAAPDSDGTLGGLARQGRADRFVHTLEQAVAAQKWCSSDPLCISGAHAFTESASGAACHSCLLVSETSCEEFNRLLDRRTLVGDGQSPGFFEQHAATR